jgi:hypothetical protein
MRLKPWGVCQFFHETQRFFEIPRNKQFFESDFFSNSWPWQFFDSEIFQISETDVCITKIKCQPHTGPDFTSL